MAYQHTTPHQSIAAAHAAEQRAKAGQTSRMKMDACYQLYEAALQCVEKEEGNKESCAEAFEQFKDCRKTKGDTKKPKTVSEMMAAQEKDPLVGWLVRAYILWMASPSTPSHEQADEAEPEWKRARRLKEQQQQLAEQQQQEQQQLAEQQQQEQQQLAEQQQQERQQLAEQQQQQRQARSWMWPFKRSHPAATSSTDSK